MTDQPKAQPSAPSDAASEPHAPAPDAVPRGTRAMAVVRWTLVAIMATAATASIASHYGWLEHASGAGESEGPESYRCPMHPAVVQDHPGQCPVCDMSLVPAKNGPATAPTQQAAGETQASAEPGPMPAPAGLVPIDLSPERVQLVGMRTAQVKRSKLVPELRATGYVTARESGLAQVHARFAGWIETLPVSETGQRVTRGQVLATVYSQELLAAQQDLLNALKWSSSAHAGSEGTGSGQLGAGRLADDARRRLQLLGISEADIDEVVHSGKPKNALSIRAPITGYVTRKTAVLGLYVEPGTELFELADLSLVWVMVDIHEQEIPGVRRGAHARFTLSALPTKSFAGRVQLVYPSLDTGTRTLRLRLELQNPGLALRPGMVGDAVVEVPATEGLVVPAEAIVDTGTAQYLFVARGGGRFEPRKIRLGTRAGEQVQVLEGVREGETIVTTANFLLDSKSRLQASIGGASTEEAEQPAASTPAALQAERPAEAQAPARAKPAVAPRAHLTPPPPEQPAPPPPAAPPPAPPLPAAPTSACDRDFDARAFADKYRQCRACEIQHRGMGSMVDDCKAAIPKPWR
jgi:Cu(I)/Ag(I) efflux system membrane fusion protein